MMRTHFTRSACLMGFGLFLATSLGAQSGARARDNSSRHGGLVVGAHLNGAALSFEAGDTKLGGGAGVLVGYEFIKRLTVYVSTDVAKVKIDDPTLAGNYLLRQTDVGLRYAIGNRWRPYLTAAYTLRSADADLGTGNQKVSAGVTGPATTFGAGIEHPLTQNVAFDVALLYSTGKFKKVKLGDVTVDVDDAETSTTTRLNVGVRYYPTFWH